MNSQSLNARFASRRPDSGTVRIALALCATLALSVSSLWADTPTPGQAAAATSGTIAALISANDPNFASDAATAVDNLMDADKTAADETAIVKAALGTISDAAAPGSSSPIAVDTLLAGDQAIGQALAADSYLEGLTKDALTTILQNAIAGISGIGGKAQTVAPEAAAAFVEGLVSSGVPDGETIPDFAVAILKKVSPNTRVDELVAYQAGLQAYDGSQANLVALATAFLAKYPSAADVIKLTQGITAILPAGANTSFIEALTTARVKDAVPIAEGAVFSDPDYAGELTEGVLNSIVTAPSGSAKLLETDATAIARDAGSVLGQDGNALTQVADTYSQLIGNFSLPVTSAATYATSLIKGAVTSKVPLSEFTGDAAGTGGGRLVVGAATVTDLSSILDLLLTGILTADQSLLDNAAGLKKVASEVSALTAAVTRFTRNETFTLSDAAVAGRVSPDQETMESVTAWLAGSASATIAAFEFSSEEQLALETAIGAGVKDGGANKQTVTEADSDIVTQPLGDTSQGAISNQETTVVNL